MGSSFNVYLAKNVGNCHTNYQISIIEEKMKQNLKNDADDRLEKSISIKNNVE